MQSDAVSNLATALIAGGGIAVGAGLFKLGLSIGQLSAAVRSIETRMGDLERRVDAQTTRH